MRNIDILAASLQAAKAWYSRTRATSPGKTLNLRSLAVDDEMVADGDTSAVVASLVSERANRLGVYHRSQAEQRGRLLLLYIDENLMDGAAAVASSGFLGPLNFPPCDLWLGLVQDLAEAGGAKKATLVSWIPGEFVSAAQAGIDVNPEECFEWSETGAPSLADLLELTGNS